MKLNIQTLFAATILFSIGLLTSCGGKSDGGSPSNESGDDNAPTTRSIEEQPSEGEYRAILRPLNNSLSGFIPTGFAEIKIKGNDVMVKTMLDDDAKVAHMQSIHIGTECPTLSSDTNNDGLIDILESRTISGSVLIPLDSDLSSDTLGAGIYPMGKNFTYLENTSLSELEVDVKNRTGENLNLSGRVIMIHGVDEKAIIPASVSSLPGITPHASMPIACGMIKRIEPRQD